MQGPIRTPILMYHSVTDAATPGFGRFVVKTKDFNNQMLFLKIGGYTAISVSDFLSRSSAGQLDNKTVVLTFDDGFVDFCSVVLPSLSAFGFTATLYIVSGFVGKTSAWLQAASQRLSLLDWSQISQAVTNGIEVGAHTVTHPKLDLLPRATAQHEIRSSKLCIEDRVGVKVSTFAYPFGFRDDHIINMVRESGFESACAVRYKTASGFDNVFDLPRHIVRGDMSIEEFERLVVHDPPAFRQAYDRTRSHLGSVWRRTCRKVLI